MKFIYMRTFSFFVLLSFVLSASALSMPPRLDALEKQMRRPRIGRRVFAALALPLAPALASAAPYRDVLKDVPPAEAKLLQLCRSRRPAEWRDDERVTVDALVEELVALRAPWTSSQLTGTWRLAYLQPGPEGGGVDRRVPFPEFPFNESFQRFVVDETTGRSTVNNVGEVLGPAAAVIVSGCLSEEDIAVRRSPKRFRADIDGGRLCLGGGSCVCLPLPISGVGLFDGVYLGKTLRIGQNLNGGGARIVQVRVDLPGMFETFWGLARAE